MHKLMATTTTRAMVMQSPLVLPAEHQKHALVVDTVSSSMYKLGLCNGNQRPVCAVSRKTQACTADGQCVQPYVQASHARVAMMAIRSPDVLPAETHKLAPVADTVFSHMCG